MRHVHAPTAVDDCAVCPGRSFQRATLVIGGGLAITLTCLLAVLTPSLRTVNVKLDETEADIS